MKKPPGLGMGCLGGFYVYSGGDDSSQDRLIWTPSIVGRYSCKSFGIILQENFLMVPI